jgi:hypothetical protein
MEKNSLNEENLSELFFSSNLKLILAIMKFEEADINLIELSNIRKDIMSDLGIPNEITATELKKNLLRFAN